MQVEWTIQSIRLLDVLCQVTLIRSGERNDDDTDKHYRSTSSSSARSQRQQGSSTAAARAVPKQCMWQRSCGQQQLQ